MHKRSEEFVIKCLIAAPLFSLFSCKIVDFSVVDFRESRDDAQDEHVESRRRGGQQSGRPVDVRDYGARRVDAEDGREERADAADQRRPCPLFEVVSDSAQGCLLNRCMRLAKT